MRYSAAMASTPPPSRPFVALGILAAFAIPIVLVGVYAEPISDQLAKVLPARAQPIPALFFCLALAVTVWIAVFNLRQARASASWPTAAGRIVRSDVVKEMLYPGRARTGTKVAAYRPVVEFEYAVSGQKYRSDHVQFGAIVKGEEADARARLAPYPLGRELPVRYDPARPATAVLASTVAYPIPTMFMVVLFAGAALYFLGAF